MARGGVGVWQMAPAIRAAQDNLARLETAAGRARDGGATILVTPELALTGYDIGELSDADTSDELLTAVRDVARRTGIALVVGLALRADGGTWNCSAVIDRSGAVRDVYRKTHLFGELDRSRFDPGSRGVAVVELEGIAVATVICYDIEFPEPARTAAMHGAQLLAVPTANMTPWEFVNDHVIPVRAFENQMYVAYANHCGTEGETAYVGRSVIAAPDGSTRSAGPSGEEVVVMPIDTVELERRRQSATYLADRRPHLYSALAQED